MSARLLVLVVVFVVAAAGTTRAQTVPQPEGSVGIQVGIESFGPPVVIADVALRGSGPLVPVVQARVDLHGQGVGLGGGAVFEQRINDWLFFREAMLAAPFLAVIDDVAVGLRGGLLAQAGFDVADSVTLAIGPELVPVMALDTSSTHGVDGRLGCAVTGVGRWFWTSRVAATVTLRAGYDIGGRGAGAVNAGAFLGVLADW
jgi:hypothetical protein